MLRAAAVFYRFSEASALSIDAVTSGESGVTAGSKRARISPSGPTRNFVKFHLISPPGFGFADGFDLLVGAWFLRAKTVRGNSDDHEAAVLILLVNRFQRRILRREPAAAGHIHHHHHFSLVRGKRRRLPIDGIQRVIEDRLVAGGQCRGAYQQSEYRWGH